MNQDVEMPEGWTPDKYRDMVLTTWLITLWKRVTRRLCFLTHTESQTSFPQNYIPMLTGAQGLGKRKPRTGCSVGSAMTWLAPSKD